MAVTDATNDGRLLVAKLSTVRKMNEKKELFRVVCGRRRRKKKPEGKHKIKRGMNTH